MKNILLSMILFCGLYSAELPTGQTTPEGVACDMAMAFINADKDLWSHIVINLKNQEYSEFVALVGVEMDKQKALPADKRSGPKRVDTCFSMGGLSKNGPNSYSYAVLDMEDIGFVDVSVVNRDESKSIV